MSRLRVRVRVGVRVRVKLALLSGLHNISVHSCSVILSYTSDRLVDSAMAEGMADAESRQVS